MTTDPDGGTDTPVSSALGQELTAATYPNAGGAKFLEARDSAGAWSEPARAALAGELRHAQALIAEGSSMSAGSLVDGVIAALEDRR